MPIDFCLGFLLSILTSCGGVFLGPHLYFFIRTFTFLLHSASLFLQNAGTFSQTSTYLLVPCFESDIIPGSAGHFLIYCITLSHLPFLPVFLLFYGPSWPLKLWLLTSCRFLSVEKPWQMIPVSDEEDRGIYLYSFLSLGHFKLPIFFC